MSTAQLTAVFVCLLVWCSGSFSSPIAAQQDFPLPPLRPSSVAEIQTNNSVEMDHSFEPGAADPATGPSMSVGDQGDVGRPADAQDNVPNIPPLRPASNKILPTGTFAQVPSSSPPTDDGHYGTTTTPQALMPNQPASRATTRPLSQPRRIDNALQPAGFQSDPSNEQQLASPTPASKLIEELSIETAGVPQQGNPVSLVDLLAGSEFRHRRALINQYWNTYRSWAEYRFAVDELSWLEQVGQPRGEIDRLTLAAAQSAARDSVTDKRIRLQRQQGILKTFLVGAASGMLPLPSDRPLVGRYRTNFEIYASKSPMPEGLRQIHLWLPQQKSLIDDRAETITRCRDAVFRASQGFNRGSSSIASMLQAIELCRDSHITFIDSVVQYNQTIASYALAVQPNQNSPNQVVAMLIKSPGNSVLTTDPRVRQATLPSVPYMQPLQSPINSGPNQFGRPLPNQTSTPTPALAPPPGQVISPSSTPPSHQGDHGFNRFNGAAAGPAQFNPVPRNQPQQTGAPQNDSAPLAGGQSGGSFQFRR